MPLAFIVDTFLVQNIDWQSDKSTFVVPLYGLLKFKIYNYFNVNCFNHKQPFTDVFQNRCS